MNDLTNSGRSAQFKFKSLLAESKGTGSADDAADCILMPLQLFFWDDLVANIKKGDVYDKNDDYGIESDPHVTILYGITPDTLKNESAKVNLTNFFTRMPAVKIESCGISVFENEDYDVLKFDIQLSNNLQYLRRYALTLPHTLTYPDFIPHCTIAYLKKGKGKQYAKLLSDKFEFIYVAQTAVYSEAEGNKFQINFGF